VEAIDYAEMDPQFRDLYSSLIESNVKLLNTLKTYAGAQQQAEARDPEFVVKHPPKGNITAKQYNLMRLMTGGQPIAAYNDNDTPKTDNLKYYSGAKQKQDKAKADKIDKSYRLMQLMMRGS
jgi:hypothetical protein